MHSDARFTPRVSEQKPGYPSPRLVGLWLTKGKARMVNLPVKALGGVPGFWDKNSKFPVPVLPCAPLGLERIVWVMNQLSTVAGRHLIDAL